MRKTLKKLGILETFAVGTDQAETNLEEGDAVRLERSSGRVGASAIRVVARRGRTAGSLAPRTAEWLAPLMDRGWVELEGSVAGPPERQAAPLRITARLTPEGRHILEIPQQPRTPAQELHALVLGYWPPETAADREALGWLRDRVDSGVEAQVLPETRLLLHVKPAAPRSRRPSRRAATAGDPLVAARELLGQAVVDEPVTSGNLALYPVTLPAHAEPGVVPFDRALERGEVEITEVDRNGTVNELSVRNTGRSPVLLPQGLVVVGGKQDRMIAAAVVVLPGEKRTVPVSCVEAGRWSWEQGPMVSRRMATPSVRRHASRDVEAASVQGKVWEEVDVLCKCLDVLSPTESLEELYDQVDLADARELLRKLPGDAFGFAAVVGSEFLGCDLYGSPGLLDPVRERLVEAWALEARLHDAGTEEIPDPDEIGRMLRDAAATARPVDEAGESGAVRLVVEARDVQGTILLHGESLLQASLFPA